MNIGAGTFVKTDHTEGLQLICFRACACRAGGADSQGAGVGAGEEASKGGGRAAGEGEAGGRGGQGSARSAGCRPDEEPGATGTSV